MADGGGRERRRVLRGRGAGGDGELVRDVERRGARAARVRGARDDVPVAERRARARALRQVDLKNATS